MKTAAVDAWSVRLDVSHETINGFHAMLSDDERDRSARFRFARDRQRFVVARGVLRELLGRYLGIPAAEVRFAYNVFGKPALSSECGRLTFNVSHSADLAVIAISADAEIGVDVELVREESFWADIARGFFSAAEVEHLNRLPSHLQTEAFFSCWTKKEATLKARGEGLAGPKLNGTPTHAVTFQPAEGYIGALVVEGKAPRLRQYCWNARM